MQTVSGDASGRVEYSSCTSMEYLVDLNSGNSLSAALGPYDMSSLDLGKAIAEKERAFDERLAARGLDERRNRESLEEAYDAAVLAGLPWPNASERLRPYLDKAAELERTKPIDRSIQVYKLEYFKKFSIPAGALCFVFLAFPLGLRARKSGRSVGFGLGLLVAVLYWALLLGGQTLGTRLGLSPFWSMWGADIFVLVAAAGLWAYDKLLG